MQMCLGGRTPVGCRCSRSKCRPSKCLGLCPPPRVRALVSILGDALRYWIHAILEFLLAPQCASCESYGQGRKPGECSQSSSPLQTEAQQWCQGRMKFGRSESETNQSKADRWNWWCMSQEKWMGRRSAQFSSTTPRHQHCGLGRAEAWGCAGATEPLGLWVQIHLETSKYAGFSKFC
jgi:hypothetical protein